MTTAKRLNQIAWNSAVEVAVLLGAPPPSLHALGSTNHVFLLNEPPLAFNVAASDRSRAELSGQLAATRLLAELGVFIKLHPGLEQPVVSTTGRLVTVWERVQTVHADPDWKKVGRLLRLIGNIAAADVVKLQPELRAADDLCDVQAAIERLKFSGRLRPSDAAMLYRISDRLSDELNDTARSSRRVLVHGDLWQPNVLTTAQGPILCDADEVGVGPEDWDIAALLDWRRPTSAGPARVALLEGWGGDLPRRLRVRCLMRAAHLRRTVKRLARSEETPRDGYWNLVRLGAWQRVFSDWNYDGFPELHQSRPEQVFNVLGRTRKLGAERLRTVRS